MQSLDGDAVEELPHILKQRGMNETLMFVFRRPVDMECVEKRLDRVAPGCFEALLTRWYILSSSFTCCPMEAALMKILRVT